MPAKANPEPVVRENPARPDHVRDTLAGRTAEQVAARTWIIGDDGTVAPAGRS